MTKIEILRSMGFTSCPIAIAADGTVLDPVLTDEQIAEFNSRWAVEGPLEALRIRRNRLLAATDWWANSDVTMTDEQRTYRQALRDLPANTTDPANPVWPTKP